MTPLAELLKTQIRANGPITVEEYMEACLYHPLHGYYTNGHNFLPAPKAGTEAYPHDFTTAPELTPLFGATLANWVEKEWSALGQPTPFTLLECGPGRGSLMHALLTHLQTAHPACYTATQPTLIETSPALTTLQKTTLNAFPQTQWSPTPTTLQSHNPIILIANELLDAFPHSQIIVNEGRIQPRTITLNDKQELTFIDHLNTQHATLNTQVTEHSPQMRTWLQALPQNVQAAVFLDYGSATEGATGDTFQAIHKHQKVSVFHRPGESDLTNHVNFHNVNAALAESHPHLQGQTLQPLATFLLGYGLASLALAQAPHSTSETTLHRLLHPKQMGTLFQVKCYYTSRP